MRCRESLGGRSLQLLAGSDSLDPFSAPAPHAGPFFNNERCGHGMIQRDFTTLSALPSSFKLVTRVFGLSEHASRSGRLTTLSSHG